MIFKNLAKLSTQFNPVIYPFLVTMCFGNAPAREIISKDFDLTVSLGKFNYCVLKEVIYDWKLVEICIILDYLPTINF